MRRAISMIELVISIVVIGIAFMSIPLIMTETSKSVDTSVRQEAVMAGLTQMVNVMSYKWDENQTDESVNGGYAKVLDTSSLGILQCGNYPEGRRRIGHFVGEGRRKCYNVERNATPVANLGSDGGDLDDIDDIMGSGTLLAGGGIGSEEDYKKDYGYTVNVTYVSDNIIAGSLLSTTIFGIISTTASATPTNIKMIETTISSKNETQVKLRAFAANIGEVKYYSKRI